MLVPSKGSRRDGVRRGFTLVEVMVATVLLATMIVSILAVLIGAYRVAAKARLADHARFVIKSMADQFLTQQTTDGGGNTLALFTPTVDPSGNLTPLGDGLSWDNGNPAGVNGNNQIPYFTVVLADTTGGLPVTAQVTRTVEWVDGNYSGAPGTPTLINQVSAMSAGYMLMGTFTITYKFLGQQAPPLSITAVRAVP